MFRQADQEEAPAPEYEDEVLCANWTPADARGQDFSADVDHSPSEEDAEAFLDRIYRYQCV